jgi:hypothetical protein
MYYKPVELAKVFYLELVRTALEINIRRAEHTRLVQKVHGTHFLDFV